MTTSGAIRAGRAYVEIFANDSKLIKSLEKAKSALISFAKRTATIGASISAVGGTVLGVLAKAADSFISRADEIAKAAERFGTAPEVISELAYAFERVGLSSSESLDLMKDLQKNISEASSGNAELANSFAKIGVNVQEILNLPLDEQLYKIADGLHAIDNPAQRNATAMKLLGEKGGKAAALLGKGSQAIREFREEAKNIGASVSTEDAEQASVAMDQLEKIIASLRYSFISLGSAILPSADTMRQIGDIALSIGQTIRDLILENKELVQVFAIVAASISAVGLALLAIGGAAAVASIAAGGLASILASIGAAIAAVLSPIGLKIALIAAAIVGVGYALYELLDLGPQLKLMFQSVSDFFSASFRGIRDAILAGDIKLAFNILVQSLLVIWRDLVLKMQRAWNSFKSFFVDGWHSALETVTDAILSVYEYLFRKFSSFFSSIYDMLEQAAKALGFDELAEKLGKAADLARNPQRFRDLRNALEQQRLDDKKNREQARNGALQEAQNRLAEEQQKLNELIGEAAVKRELKEAEKNKLTASPGEKNLQSAMLSASRGVFYASNYQQVFGGIGGIADLEKKQLEAQKAIKAGIEQMNNQFAQFAKAFKFA